MNHSQSDRKAGLITFEGFRTRARDETLDDCEKIGFPDGARRGKERAIYRDIVSKLPTLGLRRKRVLDIGPGCSALPRMFIRLCNRNAHRLVLVDSAEMLDLLPSSPRIEKFAARYPECPGLFTQHAGKVDAIIAYSVFQNIVVEGNVWDFLDRSLSLLSRGGRMLLGDIPNLSKRQRALRPAHEKAPRPFAVGNIDDSVVLSLIMRARARGFDAYVLPQAQDLPYAIRREDILFVRP